MTQIVRYENHTDNVVDNTVRLVQSSIASGWLIAATPDEDRRFHICEKIGLDHLESPS